MDPLGLGGDAPQAPAPGQALPAFPDPDDDREKERLRKPILGCFVRLLRRYCAEFCGGRGKCGWSCSAYNPNLEEAAHELARDEFFYDSPEANVPVLKDFLNFLHDQNRTKSWEGLEHMREHFLYDLVRFSNNHNQD